MNTQSESELESSLVERLVGIGWEPIRIGNEQALWDNLRRQLGEQNGVAFSDAEFKHVRNHLEKGNAFHKAHTLRDRFHLTRDDGSSLYVSFFNGSEWCRNRYQVATQIGISGRSANRYDVTLLVNGLPLCQIELKRRGVELKQAFNQITRYQKDSFAAAGGLFQYVQIFVISNGVNTRYYANNPRQSFEQTFTWSDVENRAMNRLSDFADAFLDKCHLSKMIARYIVLHTAKVAMVLRPYQYYAAEAITERVMLRQGNGYVWHTTGSGKTLTSFKAAQNIVALPKVEKVIFVVDRNDLDHQTIEEFNAFQKDCVDQTTSTKLLVKQMADPTVKLVVTTIQKLNSALSNDWHQETLGDLADGRVVFLFDECHRSQFGETHARIKRFFTAAQLFGFTGTPIFVENAIGGRTTKDLFQECLHRYVITDAIRDHNVLRFSVEYLESLDPGAKEDDPEIARALLGHHSRILKVTDWIIANHGRKTHNRTYGAIMTVGSVDMLIEYYHAFARRRLEGAHDLKLATIFSYGENEEDPDADGLIPDVEFPSDAVPASLQARKDVLAGFVADYNAAYGTNQRTTDSKGFATYYQAVAQRMKARDKASFTSPEGIDILLVVNMFLTGFDAKTCSTLYCDRNLHHHGLIQAFSRTNRVLNKEKSQGNIVCFRDLTEETDEAIALFADKSAKEQIVIADYQEHLRAFTDAVHALLALTPTPESVQDLPHEDAQADFVKAFRDVIRIRNVLATFSEFDESSLPISAQDFEDFKSEYLDIAESLRVAAPSAQPRKTEEIDFELELITRIDINVAYIINLLTSLKRAEERTSTVKKADEIRRKIADLLHAQPQLRSKRDVIDDFMEGPFAELGKGQSVAQAFKDYWEERRTRRIAEIAAIEGLKAGALQAMIGETAFTGKSPSEDSIIEALSVQPSIRNRKVTIQRIVKAILEVQTTYDDAIGEIDDVSVE